MSKVPWTKFEQAVLPTSPGNMVANEFHEVWLNSRYQVLIRHLEANKELGWPPMDHLSIKRLDREPIHDWRDMQRIKNELVGPECEAVELYPAESRLVDTSNQYHLFVFVLPRWRFPFGYQERFVMDERPVSTSDKSKQRPFELKPVDLVSPEKFKEELDKLNGKNV